MRELAPILAFENLAIGGCRVMTVVVNETVHIVMDLRECTYISKD